MKLQQTVKQISSAILFKWGSLVAALVFFLIHAFTLADKIHILMDEGTYLLKGWYYLTGRYLPFEAFGPITNKPPLSFFSLGLSQILFGTGIRSGRYFAIFLSLLMLIGLFLTARRLYGHWWGVGLVALTAISPAWVMFLSRAMTQAVTSFLIIWSIYLVLGHDRKVWQLCVGAFLAALVPLTRQNLLPFLFLVCIYLVWEYKKKSLIPIVIGSMTMIIPLLIFWPDLAYLIFGKYLPDVVKPQLLQMVYQSDQLDIGHDAFSSSRGFIQLLYAACLGLRNYFIPIFLIGAGFIFFQRQNIQKQKWGKAIVFLMLSFGLFFVMHTYAIIDEEILVNNYPSYLAFFLPLTLLLLPATFLHFRTPSKFRNIILIMFLLILFAIIGFSLYELISKPLLDMQVPRITGGRILPGTTEIWRLLDNKYQLGYRNIRYLLSSAAGFIVGIGVAALAAIIWKVGNKQIRWSYATVLITFVTISGIILSPTVIVAGKTEVVTCNAGGVLASEELVGKQLSEMIPDGVLVFWDYDHPVPLLYHSNLRVFPSQLNKFFTYRQGGNTVDIERLGYWNDELAKKWMGEADYLILGQSTAKDTMNKMNADYPNRYEYIGATSNVNPCIDGTYLDIFKAVK